MTSKSKPTIVETTAAVAEQGMEQVKAGFEQAQATFKAQVDEATKHAATLHKQLEQMIELGKGNVEALMKSATLLAEGVQEVAKAAIAFQQTTFDETVANVKALAAAKSLREVMELQMGFAKAAMDRMIGETTKLTEHGAKLAEKVTAPMAERLNVTVATFGRPLAA